MMAKALSNDLRLRILKASAAGMSARQAAARFRGWGIECDPVDRASEARRIDPRRQGSHRASSLDPHEGFIVGLINERKDITLNEMVERLKGERSVRISRSALSACLGRHDMVKAAATVKSGGLCGTVDLTRRARSGLPTTFWPMTTPISCLSAIGWWPVSCKQIAGLNQQRSV
jgi:transposase